MASANQGLHRWCRQRCDITQYLFKQPPGHMTLGPQELLVRPGFSNRPLVFTRRCCTLVSDSAERKSMRTLELNGTPFQRDYQE